MSGTGEETGKKIITIREELFQTAPVQKEQTAQNAPAAPLQQQTENAERVRLFSKAEAVSLQTVLAESYTVRDEELDDQELQKQQYEKNQVLADLLDMAVEENLSGYAERRDEQEQGRAEILRRIPEAHILKPVERLERDRVVRTLKMDEITRQHILKSEKTLKEVLDTYTRKEERDKTAKEAKEFLLHFKALKEDLVKDPFLTAYEKAKRLYRIAKPYSGIVAQYKEIYVSGLDKTARMDEIAELIVRFDSLVNLAESGELTEYGEESKGLFRTLGLLGMHGEKTAHEKLFGENEDREVLERLKSKARRIDKKQEEERAEISQSEMNADQLSGVYAIDRWLVGNFQKSGGSAAFLDRILSLPDRERLLMYYLVQKGRLESPDAVDITLSQLTYVPDAEKFKTAASTGKYLGFKSVIAWEKLEAALEIIGHEDIALTVKSLACFAGNAEKNRLEAVQEQDRRQKELGNKELTEEEKKELEEIGRTEAEISRLETERNRCLKQYLHTLGQCKIAIIERDEAWFHKEKKKKNVEDKAAEAVNALNELKKADYELTEKLSTCYEAYTGNPEVPQLISVDEKGEILNEIPSAYEEKESQMPEFVFAQASSLMAKIDKIPSIWGGSLGGPVATLAGTAGLNMLGGTFFTMQGIMGAITGVTGIIGLIGHMQSGLGASDILADVVKMGSTALSGTWGPVSGIMNTLLAVPKAMKSTGMASEALKTATGIITTAVAACAATVNAVKLAADGVEVARDVKHIVHLTAAEHRFRKLEKAGSLQGDDAAYADNILKIRNRKEAQKLASDEFSVLLDSASLGVSLCTLFALPAAPLIVLGWTVLSVGCAVGNKIANYLADKHNKNAAAEEYLRLDDISDLGLPEGYQELDKKTKEEYRERMKEHMAAELGFTSSAGLYKHMMKNYAQFLYRNLFYRDGDESKPILDPEKKETLNDYDEETGQLIPVEKEKLPDMSLACYQLVKSLGLKVRYPETAGGSGKPTEAQIMAKLGG